MTGTNDSQTSKTLKETDNSKDKQPKETVKEYADRQAENSRIQSHPMK